MREDGTGKDWAPSNRYRATEKAYEQAEPKEYTPGCASTPDPVDAAVGAALKQLRVSRGVSMAALGRHLGLSYQQIQKYERGDNRMVASVLFRIADFFGVEVGDLFAPANAFRKRAISGGLTVLTVPGDPMRRDVPEQELVRAVSNYAKIPDESARGDVNRLMERLAGAPCSRCGPQGGERYYWEAP